MLFSLLPLVLAQTAVVPAPAPPAPAQALAIFDYDAKAPIAFQESGRETIEGVGVADVSYASPKGGRVPGYLVVPPGSGPFAAVLFMHWGQGDRTEFLAEAVRYAKSGVVSLMIDAPYQRPDAKDFAFIADAAAERDMYVQLVVDLRRGVDVLLARPDVDPQRVAYVGHSLGATWGGALAGVEKRIGSFVLMGGLPRVSDVLGDSDFAKRLQKAFKREQLQAYAEAVAPIDPERFVVHAGADRLLFQFALHDRYISAKDAAGYEKAAGARPSQRYFTSHEFNDEDSARDRRAWLFARLALK
jgi:cephalosporin-C deacetylase-like acetyl esterase